MCKITEQKKRKKKKKIALFSLLRLKNLKFCIQRLIKSGCSERPISSNVRFVVSWPEWTLQSASSAPWAKCLTPLI